MKKNIRLSVLLIGLAVVLSTGLAINVIAGSGLDAQIPIISEQPTNSENLTMGVGDVHVMSVTAEVKDGGSLTYQWYHGPTKNIDDFRPIGGATNKVYVDSVGEGRPNVWYYYVIVTNTIPNNGDGGKKSASVMSEIARVEAEPLVHAAAPHIKVHPQSVSVEGKNTTKLTVVAESPDGGELSYAWFGGRTAKRMEWTQVSGEYNAVFIPNTDEEGTFFYGVVVTNTNVNVNGKQTESTTSSAATVLVSAEGVINAAFPVVFGPNTIFVERLEDSTKLSVEAESPDGGTLTYQWYKTPMESNELGVAIEGATEATFDPGSDAYTKIATYYYVKVTNTNNKVNGVQTAQTASQVATVLTGVAGMITAIQTKDRDIPTNNVDGGVAVVIPTKAVTNGFSVGSNPTSRSADGIVIFRQGLSFRSGTLTVFDATGNVIKKISVRDNASGGQSRRQVGSWDLKDAKGRPVSAGTYLVKGTVKTSDGKREKVSIVLGVR